MPAPVPVAHATSVAVAGRGLLIRGASGSGKSSLALEMMALGAQLVADDRTELRLDGDGLVLCCPAPLLGLIEARGIGLLNTDYAGPVPLVAVVDLDRVETERLPPKRAVRLHGHVFPVIHKVEARYFPAALCQYLKAGRQE